MCVCAWGKREGGRNGTKKVSFSSCLLFSPVEWKQKEVAENGIVDKWYHQKPPRTCDLPNSSFYSSKIPSRGFLNSNVTLSINNAKSFVFFFLVKSSWKTIHQSCQRNEIISGFLVFVMEKFVNFQHLLSLRFTLTATSTKAQPNNV